MRIIGINLSHDGSACLLVDGETRVALALERLVRVQRGVVPLAQFPRAMADLIDYCLKMDKLSIDDIDYFIGTTTESISDEDEAQILRDIGYFPPEKILALPHPSHHLAHACAAFYGSGFESSPALVIDAYGSLMGDGRESETAFWCDFGREPRVLFRNRRSGARIAGILKDGRLQIPRTLYGIGEIYRLVSMALGFRQRDTYYDDPGKTMGLAPYGRRLSEEPQMIRIVDGELDFNNAYAFLQSYNLVSEEDGASYLNARPEDAPLSRFHRDLACQVQWEFEEACMHLVRRVLDITQSDRLVLGGGSFLNSVLNHRILRDTKVRRLFIFPAATDDGNSIGAALYAYHAHAGTRRRPPSRTRTMSMNLGRVYSDQEIRSALDAVHGSFEPLDNEYSAAEMAAERLSAGEIVGWFQGGAELGPRALGNRSILANPCLPDIKDRLNGTVKFRESFRPFAGAVTQEDAPRFFDLLAPASPYMLLVCEVKEEVRGLIPGVTHIDGTCRAQTVSAEDNELFHGVIAAFGRRTQVPVVLNTSFNLRGMPIVETPLDALHCFYSTQMMRLFLGRYVVNAPDYGSFVPMLRSDDMKIRLDDTLSASTAPNKMLVTFPSQGRDARASSFSVTQEQARLLSAIDGRKSLAAAAAELGLDLHSAIPQYLVLYRKKLFRWRHIDPAQPTSRGRSHFNISMV